VIAIGTFAGDDQHTREIMMKVRGVDDTTISLILENLATKVKDIRFCCN
jgi:hypothetical protein